MKRFEDLTDPEVLELTDAEFARWVDLECAFEGSPLLPPAPVPPEKPAADCDLVVYQIGSITFKNPDEAGNIAAVMNACRRYELNYLGGPRYEKRATPDQGEVAVSPVRVFSPAHWEACKDELNAFSVRQKAYEADKSEYDKAVQARDRICESMNATRERVWADDRRRSRMRDKFSRYLELAAGDRQIAVRFLVAAEPDALTVLPELGALPTSGDV